MSKIWDVIQGFWLTQIFGVPRDWCDQVRVDHYLFNQGLIF